MTSHIKLKMKVSLDSFSTFTISLRTSQVFRLSLSSCVRKKLSPSEAHMRVYEFKVKVNEYLSGSSFRPLRT